MKRVIFSLPTETLEKAKVKASQNSRTLSSYLRALVEVDLDLVKKPA